MHCADGTPPLAIGTVTLPGIDIATRGMNKASILRFLSLIVKIGSGITALASYSTLIPAKYLPIAALVFGAASVVKDTANRFEDLLSKPFVIPPPAKTVLITAAALSALMLAGCAHTDVSAVNAAGKSQRILHIEGDSQLLSFSYQNGDQKISLTCQTLSHSTATLAQGNAAHEVLGGVATLTTAAGMAAATSGMLPGGIGALVSKIK